MTVLCGIHFSQYKYFHLNMSSYYCLRNSRLGIWLPLGNTEKIFTKIMRYRLFVKYGVKSVLCGWVSSMVIECTKTFYFFNNKKQQKTTPFFNNSWSFNSQLKNLSHTCRGFFNGLLIINSTSNSSKTPYEEFCNGLLIICSTSNSSKNLPHPGKVF